MRHGNRHRLIDKNLPLGIIANTAAVMGITLEKKMPKALRQSGKGKAWILDPAVYIGDFETDLAMTQLFGSFPSAFYSAYREVNPIDKGYDQRRELYHLYHLCNNSCCFCFDFI